MPDPRLTFVVARRRPILIAERDGAPIAGISLTTGAVLPGPSTPSASTVRALRRRRYLLLRQGGDLSPAWLRRRRAV